MVRSRSLMKRHLGPMGVRAGHAVGWTSGNLFPAHSFERRGEPQKALLGQSGYWALKRLRDGREKERQGSRSVSRRQLQKRRPCYRAWTGKGKQNEEKLPTFKRYVQEAWTTLGEGERRGKERTSEHQKGQCH